MDTVFDHADQLQRFSSQVLWHFTGYNKPPENAYEILCSIVSEQTIKLSEHASTIKMPSDKNRVGFRCSCMCDIPFKDLWIHTNRYGLFGISFYKTSAILSGHFNPVLYMHKDHFLFQHAEKLIDEIEKLTVPHEELSKTMQEFLLLLGTQVKSGDLLSKIHIDTSIDDEQKNNFYYEREWRSAYEWHFKPEHVAAIMMPQNYIKEFKKLFGDKFENASIISTELVVDL